MNISSLLQSPVVSGLLSGVLVAFINHIFTRRKMNAEIEKIAAETRNLQAQAKLTEAQAMQITLNVDDLSNKVGYKLAGVGHADEMVLYTSTNSDAFDFRLQNIEGAEAELNVKNGTLSLNRTNNAGIVLIWLEKYNINGGTRKILPKDESIAGTRKLKASCEIKALGGEHTLLFRIKAEGAPPGEYLAEKRERITRNEWVPYETYFQISSEQNCFFRIDDRNVSKPSSIQIRHLVLAERRS